MYPSVYMYTVESNVPYVLYMRVYAHVQCVYACLQVYDGPQRKTRISLDVDLTGPVLLIPKHAFSPDLMVGDIGHVRVTNSTRWVGQVPCGVP